MASISAISESIYFKKQIFWLSFFFLLMVFFFGCAGKKEVKKDLFFDKWEVKAEASKGYSPSFAEPAPDLMDDAGNEEIKPEKKEPKKEIKSLPEHLGLPNKKVTMTMRNTDVGVVLRALARSAGQNIMMTHGIRGNINIEVAKMPWNQVFLSILSTGGFAYTRERGIIRVMRLEDIEKERKLIEADQALIIKKKELELKINSLNSKAKMAEPLLTWVYHIKYADAKELKDSLWDFLSSVYVSQYSGSREGSSAFDSGSRKVKAESSSMRVPGAILVDSHTNSLVIQAIESDLKRLRKMIKRLDRPTPQIRIEAHIVEANRKTARALGIQWGGLYHGTGNGKNYWFTPGVNTGGVSGQPLGQGVDPTTGPVVSFPAPLAGSGLTLGFVSEKIGDYLLDFQLSALQKEGKLQILSSPSITTLDNQKAIIESGRDVPYQTVEDNEVNIEFKKAVIRLEVTPYVIDGKTLKMEIKINKDELDWSNTVMGNPVVITKNAETKVVLFDGQTTVIGGLKKEKSTREESGVPWLKDIPMLGYFFKGKSREKEMEDLLIFITPFILKDQAGLKGDNIEETSVNTPRSSLPSAPTATPPQL